MTRCLPPAAAYLDATTTPSLGLPANPKVPLYGCLHACHAAANAEMESFAGQVGGVGGSDGVGMSPWRVFLVCSWRAGGSGRWVRRKDRERLLQSHETKYGTTDI